MSLPRSDNHNIVPEEERKLFSPINYEDNSDIDSHYDSKERILNPNESPQRASPARWRLGGAWSLIHLALIVLYTSLWAIAVHFGSSCTRGAYEYSPAKGAISYHRQSFNNPLVDHNNVFRGPRTPEMDEAWYNITVKYQNFRITKEELIAMDRYSDKSVKFLDSEGGYLASLDVIHELHCLNMIRQHVRRDSYSENPNTPEDQLDHVDHCIESIRTVLMCHADISVLTFNWDDKRHQPWPNFAMDRECRDWNRILEWGQQPGRKIKSIRGDILRHPTFGIPFPLKEAEKEPPL